MSSGEILTKLTIWLTIASYAVGASVFALSRRRSKWDAVARLVWTVACIGALAHVTIAYHSYYQWSQAAAYRDTARQTAEVVGLNWGGGLYINYALLIAWVMDVSWWWWRGHDVYRRRPWLLVVAWHGFLIFIVFNATVVFKTGPVRWLGLGVCLGLGLVWGLSAAKTRRAGSEYPLTITED
ncbi:MAG: hypothetical protein ABR568_17825 [Pyrinomonadaceae bacterium]